MMTHGEGCCCGTVIHLELGEDTAQVMGHRALADEEGLGNAAVALALCYQCQDLTLTIGEASGQAGLTGKRGQTLKSAFHQSPSSTSSQLLQQRQSLAHRRGISTGEGQCLFVGTSQLCPQRCSSSPITLNLSRKRQ